MASGVVNQYLEETINKKFQTEIEGLKTRYKSYYESSIGEAERVTGKKVPLNVQQTLLKNYAAMENEKEGLLGLGITNARAYNEDKSYQEGVIGPSNFGDSFVKHIFDTVSAVILSSSIEDFVTMQGMDKRFGEVFWLDIVKGDNKGPSVAQDFYVGAKGEINKDYQYSSENVKGEQIAVGDGSTVAFTNKKALWAPIRLVDPNATYTVPQNFTIVAGSVIGTADSAGTITGAGISSGSVDPSTGLINITYSSAPNTGVPIVITYTYDSSAGTDSPSVEIKLRSDIMFAQRRPLNMKWLVDSAIILSKEFGKDMEKELLDQVIAGVMNEICVEVANDIFYNAGANGGLPVTFSKTMPSPHIPYIVHRQELVGTIAEGSVDIEYAVRKVAANFVMGGQQFIQVLKALPKDVFDQTEFGAAPPVGVHTIGTLSGRYKVIQNFELGYANDGTPVTDKFVIGAKHDSWALAGYIYASFIPVMVTQAFNTRNLGVERDLVTWYGKKLVNSNMYCQGQILP
jgi:hypothetical protein